METITQGLYTADQQALNVMTTERINNMLHGNAKRSRQAITDLVQQGNDLKDFIAPLGISLQQAGAKPVISFNANGKITMDFGHNEYGVHDNAINQIAERLGVPAKYLRNLAAGEEWQRKLAAEILNEHTNYTERNRVLIRSVGDEVRGVMSDHYRRLNTMPIIQAFLEEVDTAGGVLADGTANPTKFWFETIMPEPIIIPTAKNGNVSLAFGARITSSDFGDGSLQISSFIMQGICLNGMVRESNLRQVHLGGRLPDNIQLSARTYQKDTETMASAVKDITKQLFAPETVEAKALEVQRASEMEVDIARELKNLQKERITKGEVLEVEKVLVQNNPDDGVAGEASLWKLVNGITAVAREKEPQRRREMQEIAGKLINRVAK